MQQGNKFLEFAEVYGNWYGTSKQWVDDTLNRGTDVILEIDWQGAEQIKLKIAPTKSIFILPPSLESLQQRLTNRGQDDNEVIEKRMQQAVSEMSHYDTAHYLIINDDFDQAVEDLWAIFCAGRLTVEQQKRNNADLLKGLLG